jgi:hypothetical protein
MPRLKIKTYSAIFPYIITGFDNGETGKSVVEITDYIPEKNRPRFTLHKIKGEHTPLPIYAARGWFFCHMSYTLTKR